jgi:hypothetical protein
MFCAEAQHAKTSESYAVFMMQLMMLAAATFGCAVQPLQIANVDNTFA